MKIERCGIIEPASVIEMLRKVRLRGHGRPFVYKDANILWGESLQPSSFAPPQNYVLSGGVSDIDALRKLLVGQTGHDILNLKCGIRFKMEDEEDFRTILPPIIEKSEEDGGIKIVCDGMHRVFLAGKLNVLMSVIMIESPSHPYYAFPIEGGWESVEELKEIPDGYAKKKYRQEPNYKDLFRDLNKVFPGIQMPRKKTRN